MKAIFTLLMSMACLCSFSQQIIVEKWQPGGTTRYYWGMTYLPVGYQNSTQQFPLLVFAHGLGQGYQSSPADSASVVNKLFTTGVPKYLKTGHNIPFIVLALQTQRGEWNNDDVFKILNLCKAKYRVDANRVYFTGLSFGGRAILKYLLEKPNYGDSIAAIAPMSPHYDYPRDTAIWAYFHQWKPKKTMIVIGTSDDASPYYRYTNSLKYRDSINAHGGYASLKGVPGGHSDSVWDSVYYKVTRVDNNLDIYSWLLQYTVHPVTPVQARSRILIDVGNAAYPTAQSGAVIWNNISNGNPGTWISSVKDTTGYSWNLSITSDKRPGGTYGNTSDLSVNSNGDTNAVDIYPASAVRDNFYFHNSSGIVSLTFTIPAGKVADITFWGTREGAAPRILQLRKAGDTAWKEYDGAYNHAFTNHAVFTNCRGTQVIQAQSKAGSSFGYISVIDIVLYDSAGTQPRITTTVPAVAITNQLDNSIKLLNNPAKEQAILLMNNAFTGQVTLKLFNAEGKMVRFMHAQKQFDYMQAIINTAGLRTGNYFLQVSLGNQHTTRQLIIMQ